MALLADTIHNFSDALTAVPLWIAFVLGRRAATKRYTYGYGRAEDLAGLFVIAMIALSAVVAGLGGRRPAAAPGADRERRLGRAGRVRRLPRQRDRRPVPHPRGHGPSGRRPWSPTGYHARTDGFTSLAVLVGAGGVAIGWNWADPVVGLVITVAIVMVLRSAARDVFRRLMDGVEPELVEAAETTLAAVPGVTAVRSVRMRWTAAGEA